MGKSGSSALHYQDYKSSSNRRSDKHSNNRRFDTSSLQQDAHDGGYFKEKYKSSKAMLKALEKKNQEIANELKSAQKQISRLQKQQTLYLNALVDQQSDSDSDDSSPLARPTSKYFSSQKKGPKPRVFKPYEFLPKKSVLNSSKEPKVSSPSKPSPITHKPHTKRDPEVARRVQAIPVDDFGSFILPTQVGIFTIFNLGSIDYERPAFHSKRYIYPIGLKISRYYRSTVSPDSQALYTSTILDDGNGPKFEVVADDRPDEPFVSETSSGAWTQILKQASRVRNLQVSNSGSGPEYIGLAHPSIAYIIQSLPNADKCKEYIWQKFDIIAPRPPKRRLPVNLPAQGSPEPSVPSNPTQERESSPISSPTTKEENLEVEPVIQEVEEALTKNIIEPEQSQPPKKFRIWE